MSLPRLAFRRSAEQGTTYAQSEQYNGAEAAGPAGMQTEPLQIWARSACSMF